MSDPTKNDPFEYGRENWALGSIAIEKLFDCEKDKALALSGVKVSCFRETQAALRDVYKVPLWQVHLYRKITGTDVYYDCVVETKFEDIHIFSKCTLEEMYGAAVRHIAKKQSPKRFS